MTKVETAMKTLKKGRWVSRNTLVNVLDEEDLRTVRRLRDYGEVISVRRNNGVYQYKRG
jgi:hypothetical protein